MKRLTMLLALLLLPAMAIADTPAPYDMYAIVDVSGGAAFVGKVETETLHNFEEAVNHAGGIHGRPIHYVIEDGQTNPVVVVQLYNELIAKGVPVIVGPSLAGDCAAVVPLAVRGPVAFCLTGSVHTAPGSYVFGTIPSSLDNVAVGLRYLRMRGVRRIASANTTDASGSDGDNQIRAALALPENKDMSLVDAEHFNGSDISVGAQISRIKASGAQAILCWATGGPYGTVLRGMSEVGLDIPILTHTGNASTLEMEQFASILPKNMVFVGYRFMGDNRLEPKPIRDAQETFRTATLKGGSVLDALAAQAWDAASISVAAVRKYGTGATAKNVHDYISGLGNFPGINGPLDFRNGKQIGIGQEGMSMIRWDPASKTWSVVSRPGGVPL